MKLATFTILFPQAYLGSVDAFAPTIDNYHRLAKGEAIISLGKDKGGFPLSARLFGSGDPDEFADIVKMFQRTTKASFKGLKDQSIFGETSSTLYYFVLVFCLLTTVFAMLAPVEAGHYLGNIFAVGVHPTPQPI